MHGGENLIAVRIYDGSMGGGLAVGPLVLREETLSDRVALTSVRVVQPAATGAEMALELELSNTSPTPQSVQLQVRLTDYVQRELCAAERAVAVAPGETETVSLPFRGGEVTDYRLPPCFHPGRSAGTRSAT